VATQRAYYDADWGEWDNSAHESYGRIKDAEEWAENQVGPLGKTLKEYWKVVVSNDQIEQSAILREMKHEAENAIYATVCLAATINRACETLSPTGQRAGQMSLEDMAVDETTGEVLEE
jgi:hypothetical protein